MRGGAAGGAVTAAGAAPPALSVAIPTFNNLPALRQCLDGWRLHAAGQPVELVVVEDGCRDGTREYLAGVEATPWGRRTVRVLHLADAHEQRCTTAAFEVARGELLAAWQDDMFLRAGWMVPELLRTFAAYPELGMLALSRGLTFHPFDEPIRGFADATDWRRVRSGIGPAPGNWVRLQEVDGVVRPWVVRRACLDAVGTLDEAFRPTEWDESDLAFRVRGGGWKVATCGYERLGAYLHLGSTTIGRTPSERHQAFFVRNARLLWERWGEEVRAREGVRRATWRRRPTAAGWAATLAQAVRFTVGRGPRS
jgi:O-antigen biosynthesis protein